MHRDLDAVIFDFDGVLNRNYDAHGFFWSRTLMADHGISVADLSAHLFGNGAFGDVLTGHVDLHERLAEIFVDLGCKTAPSAFTDYWFPRDLALCPDLLNVIKTLRARGVRVAIGTNNEPRRATFITERMNDHVETVFASGFLGVAKPDKAFFVAIAERMDLNNPSRILFIDDTPAHLVGAAELGWCALQYGDSSKFVLGSPTDLVARLNL